MNKTIYVITFLLLNLLYISTVFASTSSVDVSILAGTKLNETWNNGFIIGGLVLLSLIVLSRFFINGLKKNLLLSGYFITQALELKFVLGNHSYLVFPDIEFLFFVNLPLIITLSSFFLLTFFTYFFDFKVHYRHLYFTLRNSAITLIIYMISIAFFSISTNIVLTMIVNGLISLILLVIALSLVKKSEPFAVLFTLILALQLIVFFTNLYSIPALLSIVNIEYKALVYGFPVWFDAFLIVFMLGRHYSTQLRDKQQLQATVLQSAIEAKKAQDELLALQQDNQEVLESQVQERTLELNIALQELESSNKELAAKSTQDDLSGLYNRRFYDQKILAEFRRSKRNLTPLSLVLIDIDFFKKVNDNYGHLAGDQCITWLGQQIKAGLKRSSDIGCRYGGEEFCLILPDTDAKGAIALAENFRAKIEATACFYQDTEINITISCGVSTYVQEADIQPEQIFERADNALYLAKSSGRNQVKQYIKT